MLLKAKIILYLWLSLTATLSSADHISNDNSLNDIDDLLARRRIMAQTREDNLAEMKKQVHDLYLNMMKLYDIVVVSKPDSCLGQPSGLNVIKVANSTPFIVSCDSSLIDQGWTVVLRRVNGKENFGRNWLQYREGFGDLSSNFFIGLDKLHLLTQSQPHELYIYMQNLQNETSYARYDNFLIGNEDQLYEIRSLSAFRGNATDALKQHRYMKFSTFDADHDLSSDNCAHANLSGWWFRNCYHCNLNGLKWGTSHLKFAQMMIRPKLA
ncbi:maker454 [Drosophila busckii]|uniref:Maker454 n=1 Tax=Drosophila busckii TaxID=30019 RepID=A0A0M5IYQ7_DROBS|nr:maker454 [Drosophila busckii]